MTGQLTGFQNLVSLTLNDRMDDLPPILLNLHINGLKYLRVSFDIEEAFAEVVPNMLGYLPQLESLKLDSIKTISKPALLAIADRISGSRTLLKAEMSFQAMIDAVTATEFLCQL